MMDKRVCIDGRAVGDGCEPYVIAELSGNHGQHLELAKQMIRAAAAAGVDAIKLQTYTADTLTLNSDRPEFRIQDDNSLWCGETLYDLYHRAHTPWAWHAELFALANRLGVTAFSSPFDESSVDFLESLGCPCYKVASFELTHLPLLQKIAATGKPVIMSTGMATLAEITEAVATLRASGCSELVLLKCTSAYPAPVSAANLATLADLAERFQVPVGLSDHIKGLGASIAAVALGASVIERHLVLPGDVDAVDAAFSSTPDEFSLLVKSLPGLNHVAGQVHYGPTGPELDSVKYRRSIYVCADIAKGERLGPHNIKVVRPGFGLAPKYWSQLMGSVARRTLRTGDPIQLTDVDMVGGE